MAPVVFRKQRLGRSASVERRPSGNVVALLREAPRASDNERDQVSGDLQACLRHFLITWLLSVVGDSGGCGPLAFQT